MMKKGFVKNIYEERDKIAIIQVTRKNGDRYEVIVDSDDIARLEGWSVCVSPMKSGYVRAVVSRSATDILFLHRYLTNAPKGKVVDHINNNPLDNRKENLRIVTQAENVQNRKGATKRSKSGVRGVVWEKNNKNWVARCSAGGKYHFVGAFSTLEEADKAVKAFRAEHMPYSKEAYL